MLTAEYRWLPQASKAGKAWSHLSGVPLSAYSASLAKFTMKYCIRENNVNVHRDLNEFEQWLLASGGRWSDRCGEPSAGGGRPEKWGLLFGKEVNGRQGGALFCGRR